MSSRRIAQLGLGVASLVLITSVAILFKGAADGPTPTVAVAGPAAPSGVMPAVPAALAE